LELSGGNRRYRRRPAIAAAALSLALALGACGGDSSSSFDEEAGTYTAEVVTAEFPAKQRLGETTLMRLGVRNTGAKTMPALAVGVTVGGEEGEASAIPFAIRDPQPGLAEPDRPVWVLSEHYPRFAGSAETGGAETSSAKTYDFGPLDPGKKKEMVWKLTASRTGSYDVLYEIAAGLGGEAVAETAGGVQPGGSFAVRISDVTPETTVTDDGRVVEIGKSKRGTQ